MRFWGVQRFHFLQLYMKSRFLQPPEDGLLRGGCQNKMILWNWPKKTWMLYFVLLQLTCSYHCRWPSSFLPSRVASKRAQGFSSEVDILESIRHVFFQRQVCIWNKCARDHFSRKFLFALYSSALTEVYVFNCYFILWKKLCICFLSRFRTISNYNRAVAQDMVSSLFTNVCFVIHIFLIRVDILCSDMIVCDILAFSVECSVSG